MEIRRPRQGERSELAELVAESFADEMALSGVGLGSVRAQIRGIVTATSPPISLLYRAMGTTLEFWVAADRDRPLGCYALSGGPSLTISTVAVRPECRGRGIGRALMEHALERARRAGRRQVILKVLADNEPAVKLYRSLGMWEYDTQRTYTRRVPPHEPAPLGASRLRLASIERAHAALWPEVLRSSVPPEALQFSDTYKAEYLSNAAARWLAERSASAPAVRRSLLLDGEVAGFLCVRSAASLPVAEVSAPLYLPSARPLLPDVLGAAAALAAQSGRPRCRLYLSELRPEGWAAAEELGYEFERSWLYMYREV